MERDPLVRGLLLMLAAIGSVWLAGWVWQVVSRFADIILLFFLAWLLAFALNPVARRLQLLGLPRVAAVGTVYAGLALILATIGLLIVPAVLSQLVQLASSLPALATNLQVRADAVHAELIRRGLPEAELDQVYRNAIQRAEIIGATALSNSLSAATAVVNSLLRASIVLILSFYIMLDGDKIGALFIGLMPSRYREGVSSLLEQVDRTFGGFVRGQLIQATVYGTGTWVIMQLAGLPYSLVLSIFAGLAMAIPFIGPYLAMGPPLILSITLVPDTLWWVFVLLFVLQFVVVNVLAPRIMSQSVGIHPLVVFAAVLLGARVAGGWGAIFGVPVAAVLYLLVRMFYLRIVLHTPLYRSGIHRSAAAIDSLRRRPAAREVDPPDSESHAPTVATAPTVAPAPTVPTEPAARSADAPGQPLPRAADPAAAPGPASSVEAERDAQSTPLRHRAATEA